MSDKEKNNNPELEEINDDELEEVSGGTLNPPRKKPIDYDDGIGGRI
jgi:bacteriocin-like protein